MLLDTTALKYVPEFLKHWQNLGRMEDTFGSSSQNRQFQDNN